MLDLHGGKAPTRREALDLILTRIKRTPARETVPADDALGRTCACDVFSVHDLPVVRASSMDGIGVDSSMFAAGAPDASLWKEGREYARADTGDDFDDRFDAVIPIEAVGFLPDGGISLAADLRVTPGLNVRPGGSSVKKGERLVAAGTVLRPFDLAALVLGGHTCVEVVRKPVVAFIPTGNELVPPGMAPTRGRTPDSNSIMVKHMLLEMGAAPLCFPIVRDEPEALRAAIGRAAEAAEIVLVCGGSSKGGEDFGARLLFEMGEKLFHWIASAPGRPTAAAMLGDVPAINVPGPPVAAYFVVDWCVRALVAHLLGRPAHVRKTARALLPDGLDAAEGMELLRKLDLQKAGALYEARVINMRASSTIRSLTASAQLVTDAGPAGAEPGDSVTIELLR
ncbi:MAG: molybdopterin molybdotransferase MoeA [Clostridiales Family XIII bacterium]|jgi:molybdopterin molybdotransferase/putative molybdopterin biosynthesis protein|nr:molybdopterin molybdotransferase MoeA [Clostridiales Family XIII bacterium]